MAEKLTPTPCQADLSRLHARRLGTLVPSTRRRYSTDARSWIEHCAAIYLDPRDASGRDLTAWLDGFTHLRSSTRARRLSAVTSMYMWLQDAVVVATVPEVSRGAGPRARGQDDARLIGLDQMTAHRLLNAAEDHSPRMAALVSLGLTTGLRIQEMLSVNPWAVRTDVGGRVLATVTGKRARTRTVVVPPIATQRLAVLRLECSTSPYFRTCTGRRWGQRKARDSVARLGERIGVQLHPHLLRHTAASLALAAGSDKEAVRVMLDNKSVATRQRDVC